jgi:hypothetical protein
MRKLLLICLCPFLFSAYQQQEDAAAMNAKKKTIFLYSFTKYIDWPTDYKSGNFIIGVYGNNATLVSELNKMAATKMAQSQKIEIKSLNSLESTAKYHILFIPSENVAQFPDAIAKLKGHGTLLVTEEKGMIKKGSAINFVTVDSKIKFQISITNAEKQHLKISRELEALAIKDND